MKDLDSTAAPAGGGVFATYDAANQRVIVTYSSVPAPAHGAQHLQVVIYARGEIDITIGALAATGRTMPWHSGTSESHPGRPAQPICASAPIDFGAMKTGARRAPFAHGGASMPSTTRA